MHLTQHLFLSYALPWRAALERRDRGIIALAGLAPDVDAPILLAMGKEAFVEHHHDWTHHLAGAALAAAAGLLWGGRRRAVTAALAAAAWGGHIVLDMLGGGDRHPGEPYAYPVPLLWPFSDRPFDPFPFSWPLASWQNATVMAVAMALMIRLAVVEGRTVLEVFSTRLDGAVVAAIRRRFGGAESGPIRGGGP
jgi:inner membrane protein